MKPTDDEVFRHLQSFKKRLFEQLFAPEQILSRVRSNSNSKWTSKPRATSSLLIKKSGGFTSSTTEPWINFFACLSQSSWSLIIYNWGSLQL